MMLGSLARFWQNGWITELYVKPVFYFNYQGFEWIRPLGNTGMHLLFAGMALAAFLILLGLFYRVACLFFFLAFTYVELIDSTNYLNHYYFISLLSFLLLWLPANHYFSLDAYFKRLQPVKQVPRWVVGTLRLQVGMVYFFAGLAKLNADWLLRALPMKIWLPAKSHLFLVGPFMYEPWVAYLFSWFGAAYDLGIVFFLLNRHTRPFAYGCVIIFHGATAIFFPGIGVFPYVMMLASLVFFSANQHQLWLNRIRQFPLFSGKNQHSPALLYNATAKKPLIFIFCVFFTFQVLVPLRFLLYPGSLFWHEQGFRFSWRVMLMEKSGNVYFYVKEPATGKTYEVNNQAYLTPLQEKMMSTQPDMILRFAHFLAATYRQKGLKQPGVYAESYVALNGRRSRLFIDPQVNLATQPLSWRPYTWVLPHP